MSWFKRSPIVVQTQARCPETACGSPYSALVRPVETVIVETAQAASAGGIRVCVECGQMYVSVTGRVFRYHAQPQRMPTMPTMPTGPQVARPRLVPELGGIEP